MHLSFRQSYLSISSFPACELPAFSIITGENGVGKSQLLRAIQGGQIAVDVAQPSPASDIRLYDWNTLVPQDTGMMNSDVFRNEKVTIYSQINNLRQQPEFLDPLRSVARSLGLPESYIENPVNLLRSSRDRLLEFTDGDEQRVESALSNLKSIEQQFESKLLPSLDPNSQSTFSSLKNLSDVHPLGLLEEEIYSIKAKRWGRTDLFQQSFGRLFLAYRDAMLENDVAQVQANRGLQGAKPLSQEEFDAAYGKPPWDFVNSILESSGLRFRIDHPVLHSQEAYTPQLRKRGSNTAVSFSNLSSGEKILMSFAFCVYYANDRRQLSSYPKLILFDEVDAPLHPSMTKSLLDTIQRFLINEFNTNIILTTHSPATVALAPEDSIFVMRHGESGLHSTSKSDALNVLTVGVPTLAVSFAGRRQVFVESETDARVYEALYQLAKPLLRSERSLEFIATGVRSPSGEQNAGCDNVRRIATALSRAGNQSVFGLLDWDGRNGATDRIEVFVENGRNGLENGVLDPLALGLFLVRNHPGEAASLHIHSSYYEMVSGSSADLQPLVSSVCQRVFGEAESSTRSAYSGSFELMVDNRWLLIDDHRLDERLKEVFPELRRYRRSGELMLSVIDTVYRDQPRLIPTDFLSVFTRLLNRAMH